MNHEPQENSGKYRPNKQEREVRRKVYQRWWEMRDDPLRKAAEQDWDDGDKEYRMYVPEIDPDDWRSHLELPDAFAAIQTHAQETLERTSRPMIEGTEESDTPKENFCNAILTYNMDKTDFDFEYYKAKLMASIRGTAYLKEYYRLEKRTIQDPTDVDENGEIVYEEKERIDYDDTVTEWVDNERVYIDPGADSIENATDCFEREVIKMDTFRSLYGKRKGFKNTEYVQSGGDTGHTKFFQPPVDLMADEVEVLHYHNRLTDRYQVVANNIVIHDGPMNTKHKELPYAIVYHYRVPGYQFGIGIPKVIKYLSEERKAIRRLNLDRQKMQINGMFIYNNAYDLDEEELETRPFGLIGVDSNGQPLNNVIQRIEFGDVPQSYFRTEEILLEDIRRATGIDDRIQGVNSGGTATEAAILKESTMKRINMVSRLAEMDTIKRIGRLKWSNIQFFYKAPRIEKIVLEDGSVETKKNYRSIKVEGQEFILKTENGKNHLVSNEIEGKSYFKLNKKMATFLLEDYDITVSTNVHTPVSKAIKQAKTIELLTTMLSNPLLANELDPRKASRRLFEINEELPKNWLRDPRTTEDMQILAEKENEVLKAGIPLAGTKDATEEHTLVHIAFTETAEFEALPELTKKIIIDHILEEHDMNPNTGSSSELLEAGMSDEALPLPGGEGMAPNAAMPQNSVEGMPAPNIQPTMRGQMQMADMQPRQMNAPSD